MPKESPGYCSFCGKKLVKGASEPAEKWQPSWVPYGIHFSHDAFDKKTGKRNVVDVFKCPEWERTTFLKKNKHDRRGKLRT